MEGGVRVIMTLYCAQCKALISSVKELFIAEDGSLKCLACREWRSICHRCRKIIRETFLKSAPSFLVNTSSLTPSHNLKELEFCPDCWPIICTALEQTAPMIDQLLYNQYNNRVKKSE
jgi:cytidine deaminase